MEVRRNDYLVSRALRTFMWASILSSAAQQMATLTDAVVVSNLIGPDAISAVNLVMPVLTLLSCICVLFGVGGSVLAAKAMGRRDMGEVNRVFTTSMTATLLCGVFLSVMLSWLTPQIVSIICPEGSRIYPLAVSYMRTVTLGTAFLMAGSVLQSFVKTDGNPRLVMTAVMLGALLNLVFDLVFIKYLGLGIAGSAWATIVSYLAAMLVCLMHFSRPHCSFRWDWSVLRSVRLTLKMQRSTVKEGFPMSINGLLLGVCIYAFNSIVLHAQGDDGMYVWSLCLQLFMIAQMVLGGIATSLYSIGGLLVGERDMPGLRLLTRRVLRYVCGTLLAVTLLVIAFPGLIGSIFGSGGIPVGGLLYPALRIFSLMLIPYAVVAVLRALYQMIGYRGLSVVLSVAQLVVMVLFVWGFALLNHRLLWWGFPISAAVLLLVLLLTSWGIRRKKPQVALMTLTPRTEEGRSLNISVRLTRDDVARAMDAVTGFLRDNDVTGSIAYNVRLCCEELLYNIVNYAVDKCPEKHFVDVHILCSEPLVSVLVKDDGRPFNPVLKDTPEGTAHLGLRLVNGISSTIHYQYMYNQNMVYLTFHR